MPITIKIKGNDDINLQYLNNIAEEFFGEVKQVKNNNMIVEFQNNKYAQDYIKTIEPYFSGLNYQK